jgi:predicted Rossmann fold flavoprotein
LENKNKVIVIGGGPAGMMAAISSSLSGASVTLIEKNDTLGNKLLLTGNGRCNLTNQCLSIDLPSHVPTNGKFLMSAFHQLSNVALIDFFLNLGLPTKTDTNNRVFPASEKARDVAFVLLREMKKLGVHFLQGEAKDILVDGSVVKGVILKTGQSVFASKVILATGGKSYLQTGSTGDGFRMARRLGHTIILLRPSLVPMEIHNHHKANWMGLSLAQVYLTLYSPLKEKLFETKDDILFTHYGISGPAVLNASAHCLENREGYYLLLDLKPDMDEKTLEHEILSRVKENPKRNCANMFYDILPKRLVSDFLVDTGIPLDAYAGEISKEQRASIIKRIKAISFGITRLRSFREAMVTGGGVDTKEINPSTMESKLFKGLFFAGEVIDVEGYTGGFNLQIAFSTGYTAGKECIKGE